ncbi:Uncharacterized protein dnl_51010 [Desulfonema limicola]|uniref:Uncharacterized protein n=1 Tax=Desulfonema limicola TaxID=45656 RepID=A0A975BCK1_9BACT|nr:hypothetical protein [Desulfonema limicola]QTA82719.1 Uncharacterized protein dnl_51010 [Desulfonema limicola]
MTKEQEAQYEDADSLREIIKNLEKRKFKLDCGHVTTFGYYLSNDITIKTNKHPEIICSLCGY